MDWCGDLTFDEKRANTIIDFLSEIMEAVTPAPKPWSNQSEVAFRVDDQVLIIPRQVLDKMVVLDYDSWYEEELQLDQETKTRMVRQKLEQSNATF